MSEDEMYVCLALILVLISGNKITYLRDERPENKGYFCIYQNELKRIKTLADLIEVLENEELLHLTDGDYIDIDEFCKELIKRNGNKFVPDKKETYVYEEKQEFTLGMTGDDLLDYWDSYTENQKRKRAFVDKIKKLDSSSVDQIILKKTYDDFGAGMDDIYENEIYTVKLS